MPAAMGNPERLSDIKCILRSLLISNGKLDVTLPRLNGMFRDEEGENIPFRDFDYPSLQEFLRSMPDVVHLRYNRENQLCAYHVDTESSAHISSLVSRQKKPLKRAAKFNVSYKPHGSSHGYYYANTCRPPAKSSTMSTLNSLRLVLDELRKAPKYFQNHNGIRKSDILQKFKERPGKSSINSIQTLNMKLKELSLYLVLDEDYVYFKEDVFTSNANASSNFGQNKYAHQNLQVRSAPSQPTPPPPLFIQAKNPSQTSQRSFTTHQANQIPKAIKTDDKQAQKSTRANCENEVINDRIKFRLQKLIERYPEGIWAADLPSIYLQEFNMDLNYRELGFNSITEFASAVPEILNITDPEDTGRHMILDAKIPLNKSKQQTKSLASHYNFNDFIAHDKDPVPIKLSPTVCQKFIPKGMMGFDETVEHISVGSLAHEDYFEVNISEIFTPSFFWITLRKNKSKIKKLMDDLDQFYKVQDLDACRLPQVLIETGLNVACVYAKMWHRAIIKKVKPDGYAVVLFYDYGTVKSYNPNDLYYLHKRFSALPAQALACGLYNVKASQSNEWPISSTNQFVKKVWGVPLIATVCETNENNNTMMITLTDTNDSFDLHLNDWMIANGFAVHGKMVCIGNNFPFEHYKKCIAKKTCNQTIRVLDEKNSKESNVSIKNSHAEHDTNMAAIEKYKKLYCTSSESSSNDEVVLVYKDVKNDNPRHHNDLLFDRLKQLNWEKCNYPKLVTSNSKQSSRDDPDSDDYKIEKMKSRLMALKCPKSRQHSSCIKNNEILNIDSDIDSFYGINGGHGRMDPIDWSAVN